MDPNVARIAAVLDDPVSARWFRAPGRVNLMGDHTDYNEGFVLPIAIDLDCAIAVTAAGGERVRVHSLDEGATVDVAADGGDEPGVTDPPWGRYVAGVVRALGERGRAPAGLDGVLASSVPEGSGLSSSAALEVACALALADAAGFRLAQNELALACQSAEHMATGVPSGIMDQLASAAGRDGHALLIDCRTLAVTYAPMPPEFGIVVVNSGVPRTLERTAYSERRAATERIAASLGLRALRDATLEQVADEPLARHVVSENARVHETADALSVGNLAALGTLFAQSHASLRDDYRVSIRELDALVDALVDAGARGARLTGAGFGGCVVAVCEAGAAAAIAESGAETYRAATGREPTAYVVRAESGAGPFTPALES